MGRSIRISIFAGLLALAAAAFSAPAALAAPPANDDFENAVALTGASFSVPGSNVEATGQNGEPNHVLSSFADPVCAVTFAPGCETSVWYSWTAPNDGTSWLQTCDSDFDTTLAVYTGDVFGGLSEVNTNDDDGPEHICGVEGAGSALTVNTVAGTLYRIAVSGYHGATGNFRLTTDNPPPVAGSGGGGGAANPPSATPSQAPAVAESQQQDKPKKKKHKKHKKHKNKGKNKQSQK
jgi:hypothetical protein